MVCSKVESTASVCAIFGASLAEKVASLYDFRAKLRGKQQCKQQVGEKTFFLLLLSCQETSCSLLQICELRLLFS